MEHMSLTTRTESGRSAREVAPRSSHAVWEPPADRPDPVALLEQQNASRVPWLVPIRHARMSVSPFTFFRGSARIMASDLACTPRSGLQVQLGGDAHLSNFGAYASPERRLVFDQNDFDETLPGPFEWDLKRLAASFVVAGQFHGHPEASNDELAAGVTRSYRTWMAHFAAMGNLELWYRHVGVEDVGVREGIPARELERRLERFRKRATRKTNQQALDKLAEVVDGRWRLRDEPPVMYPLAHLPGNEDPEALRAAVVHALDTYKQTLDDARHALLDRYELIDAAVKVVTPEAAVRAQLANGQLVVLDIDVQGAENVRRRIPESLAVFILPPDEHELLKRLRSRGREDEEAIQRRFAESKREIARAQAGSTFDAFVVNDTLPHAIEQVAAIVSARLPAARRA